VFEADHLEVFAAEDDGITRARRLPSPQLVGTPERTALDLNALAAMGVELVGAGQRYVMAVRCSPAACATCSR
jgi:hypothetical protein